MVITGNVKLLNVMPSIAVVAEPFNHFNPTAELEKITINTTPETYSGVAVVIIEKVERERSVLVHSRIPATTPTTSDEGTITNITQNISLPVSHHILQTLASTVL